MISPIKNSVEMKKDVSFVFDWVIINITTGLRGKRDLQQWAWKN